MHQGGFIPALSVFFFITISYAFWQGGRGGGLIVRLIYFSCILECFKKSVKKNLNNFIVKRQVVGQAVVRAHSVPVLSAIYLLCEIPDCCAAITIEDLVA